MFHGGSGLCLGPAGALGPGHSWSHTALGPCEGWAGQGWPPLGSSALFFGILLPSLHCLQGAEQPVTLLAAVPLSLTHLSASLRCSPCSANELMAREAEHSLTRVRGRTRCQHCPGHHIQLCPAVPEGAAHAGLSRDGRELLQGFFWCVFHVKNCRGCGHASWLWHAPWLWNKLPNWFKAHCCKGSRGGGEGNIQGLAAPCPDGCVLLSDARQCSDPSFRDVLAPRGAALTPGCTPCSHAQL